MVRIMRQVVWCFLLLASPALAGEIVVQDVESLRSALRGITPGTVLKIAPGTYPGGLFVSGVANLTIEALDPAKPPVFVGGANAWHFSRCDGLTVRGLRLRDQTGNGLNLDDGGSLDAPVTGVTLEHLEISDIGPKGNHDGIKCSGLSKLKIRECTITGWGGQGIDLVGCHDVVISGCALTGKDGFTASAGVQVKGGSSDVVIEKCQLTRAGERPLNIGGSTGAAFFRPQGARHEAARVIARRNVIEGGLCAAAFTGVDGAEFIDNKILFPSKWIFRILQETRDPAFAPCRNVIIKENEITFRRSEVRIEVNVSDGTEPGSFVFAGNRWLAEDRPGESTPKLPVEERGGIYGKSRAGR